MKVYKKTLATVLCATLLLSFGQQMSTSLSELQLFSTYDVFGFAGEHFPGPDMLSHLVSLWMSNGGKGGNICRASPAASKL